MGLHLLWSHVMRLDVAKARALLAERANPDIVDGGGHTALDMLYRSYRRASSEETMQAVSEFIIELRRWRVPPIRLLGTTPEQTTNV